MSISFMRKVERWVAALTHCSGYCIEMSINSSVNKLPKCFMVKSINFADVSTKSGKDHPGKNTWLDR